MVFHVIDLHSNQIVGLNDSYYKKKLFKMNVKNIFKKTKKTYFICCLNSPGGFAALGDLLRLNDCIYIYIKSYISYHKN